MAGTLKLDLAQYRELEAFSKFGSDLDKATQAQLERGKRLVEILKQKQFAPNPVEAQIAIIYAGTKGLLDVVPVDKIKAFESAYVESLNLNHRSVLDELRAGKYTDAIEKVLTDTAREVAATFKK